MDLKLTYTQITVKITTPSVSFTLGASSPSSPIIVTISPGPFTLNSPGGGNAQRFDFPVPQLVWKVAHNLGRTPLVQAYDTEGVILASPDHFSQNYFEIPFKTPVAGFVIVG